MNPSAAAVDQFIGLEVEFLQALSEVFPECANLAQAKLKFSLACQLPGQRVERVKEWLECMGPFVDACKKRDVGKVIRNENFPPTVQAIDIAAKWTDADIDEETRSTCWTYINELNRLAMMWQLYDSVPQDMMGKITTLAEDLANDMQNGNGFDLNKVQAAVRSSVTEDEMRAFAGQVNAQGVQHLQEQLMGQMMNPGSNGL